MKKIGETVLIRTAPTFGWIWQQMFWPCPGLLTYIVEMRDAMHLMKGHYSAIHARLHYPGFIEEYYNNGGALLKSSGELNREQKDKNPWVFDSNAGILLDRERNLLSILDSTQFSAENPWPPMRTSRFISFQTQSFLWST